MQNNKNHEVSFIQKFSISTPTYMLIIQFNYISLASLPILEQAHKE